MLQLPHPLPIRKVAVAMAICVIGFSTPASARADGLGVYGFQPYGFYQPYGVRYRSSVATPPYFSLNPPVYYGTRHFRPYGISPFAAPPQVTAPAGYEGRVAPSGLRSYQYQGPVSNPFICTSCDTATSQAAEGVVSTSGTENGSLPTNSAFKLGQVRSNPFVDQEAHFAKR